jgi:cbb3-type cytochrome oxidase subunit 3
MVPDDLFQRRVRNHYSLHDLMLLFLFGYFVYGVISSLLRKARRLIEANEEEMLINDVSKNLIKCTNKAVKEQKVKERSNFARWEEEIEDVNSRLFAIASSPPLDEKSYEWAVKRYGEVEAKRFVKFMSSMTEFTVRKQVDTTPYVLVKHKNISMKLYPQFVLGTTKLERDKIRWNITPTGISILHRHEVVKLADEGEVTVYTCSDKTFTTSQVNMSEKITEAVIWFNFQGLPIRTNMFENDNDVLSGGLL